MPHPSQVVVLTLIAGLVALSCSNRDSEQSPKPPPVSPSQQVDVSPKSSTGKTATRGLTLDFDPESGEFIKQDTHQGLSANSCWSRGQAWAVYGFGDCYRETGDPIFLETARNLAEYALENLPADLVPYWDYYSPEIPN